MRENVKMEHPSTGSITLYKDERNVVKAMYMHGKMVWTTTYTLDEDGYVDKTVRVFSDGTVAIS